MPPTFLRRASSWSRIPDDVVCIYKFNGECHARTTEETHEDDDTEPTSGKEQVDPALDLGDLNVEAGRDDTGLVETSVELDNDFAGTVVIDDLEFTNIAWKGRIQSAPRSIASKMIT